MTVSLTLIKRNVKLFFKDKGMFFTALITPIILLILYACVYLCTDLRTLAHYSHTEPDYSARLLNL